MIEDRGISLVKCNLCIQSLTIINKTTLTLVERNESFLYNHEDIFKKLCKLHIVASQSY